MRVEFSERDAQRNVDLALLVATDGRKRKHHAVKVTQGYDAFKQVKAMCDEKNRELHHVDCRNIKRLDELKDFMGNLGFGMDDATAIPPLKGIVLIEHLTEIADGSTLEYIRDLLEVEKVRLSTGYDMVITYSEETPEASAIIRDVLEDRVTSHGAGGYGSGHSSKGVGDVTALEELIKQMQ